MEVVTVPKELSALAGGTLEEFHLKVDELVLYIKDLIDLEALDNADLPLRHVFTPGMYTREIRMPKGSLVVSRIHLTEHVANISEGVVSVITSGGVSCFKAPHLMVTPKGTRRVLYIHEDTTWTTCHVTDLTDPEEIVDAITVPTYWHALKRPEILPLIGIEEAE